ncbi:YfhO family protein, partial [Candidatus Gottesmanbacteria bacterium]|nr:YfhO family protein [Candidatus Gottesmanbacteria bacterium]
FYKKIGIITILLVLGSGLYYFQKISPFGQIKYFYPNHPLVSFLQKNSGINRFWGPLSAKLPSNLATYYHLYSPEGYDSLFPRWYGQLIQTTITGQIQEKLNRADVFIEDKDTIYRRKLLNLLGVKYFLDKSDDPLGDRSHNETKFSKDRFILSEQLGVLSIYENKEAFSRTFLAGSYRVVSHGDVINLIYDPTVNLRETIILERDPNIGVLATGSANIVIYEPNKVVIETQSTGPGLLFLSDTYFPGWQATINGVKREIYRANYAFRAVIVPAGQNKIEFVYQPESFRWGIAASFLGLGILACLLLLRHF